MRIRDLFDTGKPVFSFEFFPPKDDAGTDALYRTIEEDLKPLRPSFVSVTYGAGGATRDRTIDLVGRIRSGTGIEVMAHLTCVGADRAGIGSTLERLRGIGIENIFALRGDPSKGEASFRPVPGGFAHASELVAFTRAEHPGFCLGGACYPEGHVECRDLERDLVNLKTKVDAGVDFLITQLFFDPEDYFAFVRRARAAGIRVPILPGIMPVGALEQARRFTAMCGSKIPSGLLGRLEAAPTPEAVARVGTEHAAVQCKALLKGGAPGIHFFTLNRSAATREIFRSLRA